MRLLLDLLLHSRDDVVEPAEPALLHLVGGLALGLIQNLSVDLRLEALFLYQQLCEGVAFGGRDGADFCFVEGSVHGGVGYLMGTGEQFPEQGNRRGSFRKRDGAGLGDLRLAHVKFAGHMGEGTAAMPAMAMPAVASSEPCSRYRCGNSNYDQDERYPKSFAFHRCTS